ncbi:alkaline phosphatase family protein [Mycolicibacterium sp. P1-5]|uniref:alkaline phosphatase family protein n=1 Tax=Mycolicibacterium sp. P1-5 TaxID=2024617 RepID=UPI00188427F3|nr:alkaline phosphatase family protein [Mycolicibacterium sp. P1-5]
MGFGGTLPPPMALSSMLAYMGDELRRITGIGKVSAVTTTAVPVTGPNLLTNPGAELGDPAGYGNSTVSVPGWTATGTPTVVRYGELRNAWPVGLSFAWPNLPAIVSFPGVNAAPPGGGNQFFGGGDVATSALSQTVDLTASTAEIDSGGVPFNLSGYLGGYLLDPSFATVKVEFLDQNKFYLGGSTIGPVSNLDRWGQTGFRQRTAIGTVPAGTRSAVVTLTMHDLNPVVIGFTAGYNNAYADNLSFSIGTAQPAPPDPAPPSKVGALDHVFLVYMENKGYDDIVGSPNAPFLNSLINGYGLASNYFAVTHPSLPNYYAIAGGQVYGKTYNCASVCINDPHNLAFTMDHAGVTWAAYAQGMTLGQPLVATADYSPDQTPWPAFAGIGDDPTYAAAHMFPLDQMAADLNTPGKTAKFVWFAADEDSNGEGPVNTLAGVAQFAFSQIDPRHQYNVAALDQFLAANVPTIINSDVWKTTKSALIVTFDEDNNNITLGFGNEGNHVVTVVIPSPMAVSSGEMRGGAFIVGDHYDHYSTLRTIEDALGVPYMTNNDKYAEPLSGFWT